MTDLDCYDMSSFVKLRMTKRTFRFSLAIAYTGKVVDTINEIREKGADISLITPDLDPVFSLQDALNFKYAHQLTGVEDIRTAIVGLGLSSHDSWVMNPKVLAEALRTLHQKPKVSVTG